MLDNTRLLKTRSWHHLPEVPFTSSLAVKSCDPGCDQAPCSRGTHCSGGSLLPMVWVMAVVGQVCSTGTRLAGQARTRNPLQLGVNCQRKECSRKPCHTLAGFFAIL